MTRAGAPWGTLEQWLRTPPGERPSPPAELRLPTRSAVGSDRESDDEDELATTLERRLQEVLDKVDGDLAVRVGRRSLLSFPPVVVEWERSHPQQLFLVLNHVHPLVYRAAFEGGRLWEVLLLELVRQVARWGAERAMPHLDLLDMQRIAVAQRAS
jgi:hypothetical protein